MFLTQSRAVLRLTGADCKKLLQGVLTNDVDALLLNNDNRDDERLNEEEEEENGAMVIKKKKELYAAMLTPK